MSDRPDRAQRALRAEEADGRALVERAWRWHRWAPRWCPGPVAEWIRRRALRRYDRLVECRLQTGQRFRGRLNDDVHCTVCVKGEWEGLIFGSVLPLVPEGAVVLDIGAHAGYGALRLADRVGPAGAVHAFEPLEALGALVTENASLNGVGDRVHVHALAVAEADGEAWFHYDLERNAGLGSLRPIGRRARRVRVPTIALDHWLDREGIGSVDFLKMDVEGGEALALRGMERGLGDGRYPRMLIELHPEFLERRYASDADSLVEGLRHLGYRILAWSPAQCFETSPPAEVGHYVLALGATVDPGIERLVPSKEEAARD